MSRTRDLGKVISGNVSMPTMTVDSDFTVDTNTLHVDAINNRVGLGTSSPVSTLHVSGASVPVVLNSTNSNQFKIDFRDANATVGYIGGTSDAPFAVASSAAAELFRVNSSGNVLVNTTTAGSDGLTVAVGKNISFLDVGAGQSYATMFRQSSSAALVLGSGVRYSSNASAFASSVSSAWARSAFWAGYGGLRFYTAPEATVSPGTDTTMNERMRIDSSGYVTMPNQPMFSVYNFATASQYPVVSQSWDTFNNNLTNWGSPRWSVDTNVGTHLNTSNGRFTAPVAGRYRITFLASFWVTNTMYITIFKNGSYSSPYSLAYNASLAGYQNMSITRIVTLAVNDYIEVGGYVQSGSFVPGGGYLQFSGELIS